MLNYVAKFKKDDSAILFNANAQRYYLSQNSCKDILCASYCGPTFAGGGIGNELAASFAPFNGDFNCQSFAYCPGFRIPTDKERVNQLTNKCEN